MSAAQQDEVVPIGLHGYSDDMLFTAKYVLIPRHNCILHQHNLELDLV
jgi:hypothetical protein